MPLSSGRRTSRVLTSPFAEFRVWRDTRYPVFVLDFSSPVLIDLILLANILRYYTLEFEIRVERALVDLRECLKEAVRDKDCCREIANTLMEDIEDMSRVHKAKLDRKGPTHPGTEVECV